MVGRHSKGGLDTQAGRTVVEAVAKYQPKDGCRAGGRDGGPCEGRVGRVHTDIDKR